MKKINIIKKNHNLRFYRTAAKHNLILTSELEEVLLGLMLGDLYAERKNSNSNTRLQFKQSIVNKNYIDHLYSLFKDYCNSEPKTTISLDTRKGKKLENISIKF
jgi:hypothetical protein